VDDLATGQSTFMVEMNETANILNHATNKSLVLLDEIGRGTATFDGLSIAWSVAEYLATEIQAKTIFATHYHELKELASILENVANNALSTNTPIVGKTYIVYGQNYAFKTSTNSETIVAFSNDVFIKIKESAHVTLDSFDQTVSNIDSLPSKLKYSTYSKSVSLIEGELDVYSNQDGDSTSIATINTKLASIILEEKNKDVSNLPIAKVVATPLKKRFSSTELYGRKPGALRFILAKAIDLPKPKPLHNTKPCPKLA
jgi:hypothetical protein